MRLNLFLLISVLFFALSPVFAQQPTGVGNNNQPSITIPTRRPTINISQIITGNPISGKLRACQALSNTISTRTNNMAETANILQNTFDSISQRVQDYYQTKVMPNGQTLSNYQTLLTDIQTQKTNLQNAVQGLQKYASIFTCDQNNPGLSLNIFKDKMRLLISAMKVYKTSVKNLIVAVHRLSANGTPLPTTVISPIITSVPILTQ